MNELSISNETDSTYPLTDQAFQYAEDVAEGRIITNEWVKKSVKRFYARFIEMEKDDCPYAFNMEAVERFCEFAQTIMIQSVRTNQWEKYKLQPWQVFIAANIYGWAYKSTGYRVTTEDFNFIARQNSKTTLTAIIALYELLNSPKSFVVTIAKSQDQADGVFKYMVDAIRETPGLADKLRKSGKSTIICERNNSSYRALSSEDDKDGKNASVCIADEVAQYPDTYTMLDTIRSGQVSRPEALVIEITSGGHNQQSVGYQECLRAKQMLNGDIPDDPAYFCMLYGIDEKDDWKDEKVWIKANPNLGVSVTIEGLRTWCNKALTSPSAEQEFRVKNVNEFVNVTKAWIPLRKVDAAEVAFKKLQKKLTDEYLRDIPCCGGIDLSKNHDFTAYTLYWYLPEFDKYYAKHHLYIPEEQVNEKMKRESRMIRDWMDKEKGGYITATPGDSVDYRYLYDDILADINRYNVVELGYDVALSSAMITTFKTIYKDIDVTFTPIPNGYLKQSLYAISWEELLMKDKLVDGNPVFRWMLSCAQIKRERTGLIHVEKLDERKSSKRIDCVDTSIMAYNCLLNHLRGDGEADEATLMNLFSLAV